MAFRLRKQKLRFKMYRLFYKQRITKYLTIVRTLNGYYLGFEVQERSNFFILLRDF